MPSPVLMNWKTRATTTCARSPSLRHISLLVLLSYRMRSLDFISSSKHRRTAVVSLILSAKLVMLFKGGSAMSVPSANSNSLNDVLSASLVGSVLCKAILGF